MPRTVCATLSGNVPNNPKSFGNLQSTGSYTKKSHSLLRDAASKTTPNKFYNSQPKDKSYGSQFSPTKTPIEAFNFSPTKKYRISVSPKKLLQKDTSLDELSKSPDKWDRHEDYGTPMGGRLIRLNRVDGNFRTNT
jgi:hypothetical protein